MPPLYLLFESASGYCLFQHLGLDQVGSALAPDQQSLTELERFSKVMLSTGSQGTGGHNCPITGTAAELPCRRSSTLWLSDPSSQRLRRYSRSMPSQMAWQQRSSCPSWS